MPKPIVLDAFNQPRTPNEIAEQRAAARKQRAAWNKAHMVVSVPAWLSDFVARNTGVRVADLNGADQSHREIYDYRETNRPSIYHPIDNPLGDIQPIGEAIAQNRDRSERDHRRREADARKGRKS